MKTIFSLSTTAVAIGSLLNPAPSFALNQSSSRLHIQSLPDQADAIEIAQFGDFLRRVPGIPDEVRETVDTVEEIRDVVDKWQEGERAERERQRRQEALEAERIAAIEEQRLETERRRQFFEGLSPEQREAYIAEQRTRQDMAAQMILMLFASMGTDNSTPASEYDPLEENRLRRLNQPYQPAPQPAPPPVAPIDPFYGNGPAY